MRLGLVARGAVALGLVLGCGGVSVDHEGAGGSGASGGKGGSDATGGTGDPAGGTGGTTGGTGGGTSTTGGTGGTLMVTGGSGGLGGGTTVTGGSGNVGGTTGGTGGVIMVTGGTGNVGTGGTAMGGTGGAPDPEVCKLPLVTGPCDASILAYGFDTTKGYCDAFYYGGCEGNANRFDRMSACASTCGFGSLTSCPIAAPVAGEKCAPSSDTCTYSGFDDCLCQVIESGMCVPVVEICRSLKQDLPPPDAGDACEGPDCPSKVVIPPSTICACNGTWACKNFY